MSKSLSFVPLLTLAVIASGCAQQGSAPQSGGLLAPAAVPADLIPYRFSGGSGTASFTAKGKDDSCSGTLTFSDNVIYVDVNAKGDVEPGKLSNVTLAGTSTCKGKPFEFPEVFELTGGTIKNGKVNDVVGKPPSGSILGSFKLSGPVCDATVHVDRYIASGSDGRVQVNSLTIKHLQKGTGC